MAEVRRDDRWYDRAACLGTDPGMWVDRTKIERWQRDMCLTCPVLADCLMDALDLPVGHGSIRGATLCNRSSKAAAERTDTNLEIGLNTLGIEVRK